MPPEDDAPDLALAKRRGKRMALAAFVAFAAVYIVLSTWEVIAGVFGYDAPGNIAAHGKPDPACVQALRAGANAKDDAAEATAADSACRSSGLGGARGASSANLDALAALYRFRRARAATRHAEAIAPLRHDLDAYLEP